MAALIRQTSNLFKRTNSYIRNLRPFATFDDDGDPVPQELKTTITILNEEHQEGIFIDTYSEMGFKLNSGIRVMGPCIVFPRSILHWNIRGASYITPETVSLFPMLEPKLDLFILGVGERENLALIKADVIKFLRSHRINIEILPTDQALATFNFLNSEKRLVAGAMIPPAYVEAINEEDTYTSLLDTHLSPTERDYMFTDTTDKEPDFPTLGIEDTKKTLKKIVDKKIYRKDKQKEEEENPEKF